MEAGSRLLLKQHLERKPALQGWLLQWLGGRLHGTPGGYFRTKCSP